MYRKVVLVGLLAGLCCALSGCGLKGPLYMPEQTSVSLSSF